MTTKKEVLKYLYKNYIINTKSKAIVTDITVVLCLLTNQVNKTVFNCCGLSKVYVGTRVLKHLYDKKPAEEFIFIINSLHRIVKYPDKIYKNKNTKRGDWVFVKKIKNEQYICSLGVESQDNDRYLEVATVFRIRKESYLKSYEFLWSWEDGNPPS